MVRPSPPRTRRCIWRLREVYSEKVSGARDGPGRASQAAQGLDEGDVFDRDPSRSAGTTRDLLNILDTVAKAGAASGLWLTPGPIRRHRTAGSC